MKTFHALTDAELEDAKRAGVNLLAEHYRDLRDHHVAETAHHAARDRSAILRMAGNIAGGLVASLNWHELSDEDEDGVAVTSVSLARKIVDVVDGADVEIKVNRG